MDAEYRRGQRLFVETTVGTVEGVFYYMDTGHNRLTLNNVVLHPSGKKMEGLYHFYRNEVVSVRIMDPGSYTGVGVENEAAGDWYLFQKVQSAVHADKVPGKVTESDVVMNSRPRYQHKEHSATNCRKLSEQEYDALNKRVECRVLIKNMGNVFSKAVEDIKAQPAVGLSVEGAQFGRYSKLTLLSFATPSCAFLFDIYILGDAAFDNGLRDILESQEIEKVIHNCRLVSDCLYHKHRVKICGIFDTQVADLMVTQQRSGQFPRCVRSLPQCLTTYLNLPDALIYHPQIRDGYAVLDSLQWSKRPLPIKLEMAAVKNSVFLLHLRKKIHEELMKPFYRCVDVFLSVVRDADQIEASEHQATDARVPFQLLSLNDQPKMAVDDQKILQSSVPNPSAS